MSYSYKRLGIGPPRLGGRRSRAAGVVAAVAVMALAATGLPANAGPAGPRAAVDSQLLNQLQQETSTGFLVYLREQADLSGAAGISGSDAKAEYVYKQLARTAERSQAGLIDALDAAGANYQPYWISNAVWVEGDSALLAQIAARSEVLKIEPEKAYPVVLPRVEPDGPHVNAIEWGLTNIEAPRVWTEFGVRGEGITVANIDTGVDFDHPAVVRQYRGNLGSGTFNHNYNWFDPSNVCPGDDPCDNNNHGTHTMGTMVGDDAGANQIGVAPNAKWMAAKGCESSSCSNSALLASAQFVLAPTDLTGNNPRPDLHADIVNNSWGGGGGDLWYQASVNAWVAAGIFPAFSNGNSGPSCGSAGSPGDYPQSYSAGAYDINNTIASFSSRGPSDLDGTLIKPDLAAPGVNVRSSINGGGYGNFSGTSMASPHLSGTVALMWSAAPSIKGNIAATRTLLDDSATDVNNLTCGGTLDNNNVFGEGRLNAFQAVNAAPRGPTGQVAGTVTNSATGSPIAGATVSASNVSKITGADGKYTMQLPVGTYTMTARAFGYATGTATVTVVADTVTTQDFALTPLPSVTVSGTVTDGSGKGWPLYAKIEIAGRPGGPVFTNPATGAYSFTIPNNTTYQLTTTAIYPGYQTVVQSVPVGGSDLVHNIAVPVDPACTANGYAVAFGTPAISEPFDTTSTPAGWSVVNRTTTGGWRFDDPDNRGNLTGGTGNFAIMDSDFFGSGRSQDSDLVTPAMDLSGMPAPYVRFNSDYRAFSNSIVDIDVSVDGGANWTNVWKQTTVSLRGPRQEVVPLGPTAAGATNVTLRFRMRGTFAWWWEVDNVEVLNRACVPQPGGLVVGFTSDRTTGAPLNGVTVTSDDNPANTAVSAATPDDPNIPDGFYWFFSSLTGPHPVTASKSLYQSQTKTVTIVDNGTVREDFSLGAGRVLVAPTSLDVTVPYGSSRTGQLTFTNTGTAPAQVQLLERSGGFEMLSRLQGAQLVMHQVAGGVSKGMTGTPLAGVTGASPQIDPAWTTIANYPATVMDNVAATNDGKVYVVGGATGTTNPTRATVYDPDTNAWTALPNLPVGRAKPAAAFVDGKLYVFGGWASGGVPVNTVAVFDPAANSWTTLPGVTNPAPAAAAGIAVANDKIYLIGGCLNSSCTTSDKTVVFDPASGSFTTGAAYPHAVAWASCGGISGRVYCAGGVDAASFRDAHVYNPTSNTWSPAANMPLDLWGSAHSSANGMLIVAGGVTDNFTTVTNRAVMFDPIANTWSNLPNAQLARYRGAGACGFFKIGGASGGFTGTNSSEKLGGLNQCEETTDVRWLSEAPATFTLAPGASQVVTVTFTATSAVGVLQPGTYTAQIGVRTDTPHTIAPIPVTMRVKPPDSWGKLTGTVMGQTCGGDTVPVPAFIRINEALNPERGVSITAGQDGKYGWWLPFGRYDVIVSKDGWASQSVLVRIDRGTVLTKNFLLQPFEPCPTMLGGV